MQRNALKCILEAVFAVVVSRIADSTAAEGGKKVSAQHAAD